MKIYNYLGVELLDIQVDDKSYRYKELMSDNQLFLYFSLPYFIELPLGSYVDFKAERYYLSDPENFKMNHTRDWEYTIVLDSYIALTKTTKFKFFTLVGGLVEGDFELKFSLIETAAEFAALFVNNMNNADPDGGWEVGDCIESEPILLDFNHTFCYDVLSELADKFKTEWEIEGKTLHIRKVEKLPESAIPLTYGYDSGLIPGFQRSNAGTKKYNRLYVETSERNIDSSTYGRKTLSMLKSASVVHKGITYVTDASGSYIERQGRTGLILENSADLTHIYPKRVGTVSDVIVVNADSGLYDFTDEGIEESLDYNDYLIAGETMTVIFQTGELAGLEFDVQYVHSDRKFKLVPISETGIVYPSGSLIPVTGDKYAVFHCALPTDYIELAETEATTEAAAALYDMELDKYTYNGVLDELYAKRHWLEIGGFLNIGYFVSLTLEQAITDPVLIRIVAVKDYVNKPMKPEITLSNEAGGTQLGTALAAVKNKEQAVKRMNTDTTRMARRGFRDAQETAVMLQNALLNFTGAIQPVTVQTMQLLLGDKSLQFDFVANVNSTTAIPHAEYFNKANKTFISDSGILMHKTLGIDTLSSGHAAAELKKWTMSAYVSPVLSTASEAYYLYARVNKMANTGTFLLSTEPIAMEAESGFYHLLMGTLNSEYDGDRSYSAMYGYAEITPGRMTIKKVASPDGEMVIDLETKTIQAAELKFKSNGSLKSVNESFSDIANDDKLTPSEKQQLKKELQAIDVEFYPFMDSALAVGATGNDYDAHYDAYDSLWTYAYPFTVNLTTTDICSGEQLRNLFSAYSETKELLQKLINDKIANNAAVDATNKVNAVQIGGVNVYKCTDSINSIYGNGYINRLTDYEWQLAGQQNDSNVVMRIYNVISKNGWWTVSFDLRGSQGGAYAMSVDICDNAAGTASTTTDNTYKRVSFTANVQNYSSGTYHFVDINLPVWVYYYIRNIQIEYGNKATDYHVAKEDAETDALNRVKEYGNQPNMLPFAELRSGWNDFTIQGQTSEYGINMSADWALFANQDPDNVHGLNTLDMRHTTVAPYLYTFGYSAIIKGVSAGNKYIASIYTGAHKCDVELRIEWVRANGSVIYQSTDSVNGYNRNVSAGGTTLSGYKRLYVAATAPADAVGFRFIILKFGTYNGYNDSYLFACRPQMEFAESYVKYPGDWKPYISAVELAAAKAQAQAAETVGNAIKNNLTTIDGGLILTTLIKMLNGVSESAGMAAKTLTNDIAFWGGGTLEEAIQRITAFGVTHSGEAWFKGAIEALSGKIGLFEILAGNIIGRDTDGIEKIRMGIEDIPAVSNLSGQWVNIFDVPEYIRSGSISHHINDDLTAPTNFSITKKYLFYIPYATTFKFYTQADTYFNFPEEPQLDYSVQLIHSTILKNPNGTVLDSNYTNGSNKTVYTAGWYTAEVTVGFSDMDIDLIDILNYTDSYVDIPFDVRFDNGYCQMQETVQKTAIGKNGFYSYFSNLEHIFFKAGVGFIGRGAFDLPAGLGGGKVTTAGVLSAPWGGKPPTGCSGTTTKTITHNIGDTDYTLMVTMTSNHTYYIAGRSSTQIQVVTAGSFEFIFMRTK